MNLFKGIIFDFNGTLFLDSHLHEQAWIEMAATLRHEPLTVEEFRIHGHGRTNKMIIEYLLGYVPSQDEWEAVAEKKEQQYRQLCLQNPTQMVLAPGAEKVLNEATTMKFPITIATGSYAPNVDFYFKHLNLSRWFDRNTVVLDNGTFPGKPAPDIFIKAAQQLNVLPGDCLVFEDSYSGIESAWKAGIGHIVAVEPTLQKTWIQVPESMITFCNGFEEFSLRRN